jgi:TatD DNase family protein
LQQLWYIASHFDMDYECNFRRMIDTHCHLDHKQFDGDRSEVATRAFQSGVEAMIIPAIEQSRFVGVRALVDSDERLYCGMGIHPHHATEATDIVLALVEELSYEARVQAIGEIGLDYYYDFAPKDVQQDVFRKQLRIAKRRGLPVIIHNRESDDDLFRILHDEQDGLLTGVLHCFSGTPERAGEAIALGFHVSFTGNITFKSNIALAETVQAVPHNRFMIETDAPYMTPVPFRGKRNEPAHVRLVAEKIAEIRSTTFQEIISMTSTTAKQLFRLATLLLVFMTLLAVFAAPSFAQTQPDDDDEPTKPFYNPFPKKFGIGLAFIASNTIVENFRETGNTVNNPAAQGIAGSLMYYLSDYFSIVGTYSYAINTALTARDPNTGRQRQPNPDYYHEVDLSLQWTLNPANVFSFYLIAGPSYIGNAYNVANTPPAQWYIGVHGGFGGGVNINTPLGIFFPTAEVRVGGVFGISEQRLVFTTSTQPPAQRTLLSFSHSIIRAGVSWFPKF